jgi:hypothetical protein
MNNNKWLFFNNASKPPLSAQDVRYWKVMLGKILKVGMEFEFNLPESKGDCKGDNQLCPCSKLQNSTCWNWCMNYEECSDKPHTSRCSHNVDGNCGKGNKTCVNCAEYLFKCPAEFCTGFISSCANCGGFTKTCDTCEYKFDPKHNPDHIRATVDRELQPSHSYGSINKSGVHSIVTDGSLLGNKGMEVITIGRRVDYFEFYRMTKEIIDSAVKKGAYVNERCSIHMHILAAYYANLVSDKGGSMGISNTVSELERSMPQIILSNFHQLCRRYQNAITWMTMGLTEKDRLTRWEKYRVSILNISSVPHSMSNVQKQVSENAGGNKYGWVNYNYTRFDSAGDVKQLHLEMRVCDCLLAPSAVAGIGCMFYALMIKAIEISRYGVLEVGNDDWLQNAKKVKEALLNNRKGWKDGDRFCNTSKLYRYYDVLTRESLELVRQLKHILLDIGPAYSILEQLAERPAAIRLSSGETWEDIEQSLVVAVPEESVIEGTLGMYIDLRLVNGAKTMDDWIAEVGKTLGNEPVELPENVDAFVKGYIDNKVKNGEVLWSDSLGTIVRIS